MWLKKHSPKSRLISISIRPLLISLFSEHGRWSDLECLIPQVDTLSSIMSPFPIGGHNTSTILLGKIAKWLARCSGLTPERVPLIKAYVACLMSKEAYSPTAIQGQQQMKNTTSRASKCACTNGGTLMVMAVQLDRGPVPNPHHHLKTLPHPWYSIARPSTD
jgi:hypothetical protein